MRLPNAFGDNVRSWQCPLTCSKTPSTLAKADCNQPLNLIFNEHTLSSVQPVGGHGRQTPSIPRVNCIQQGRMNPFPVVQLSDTTAKKTQCAYDKQSYTTYSRAQETLTSHEPTAVHSPTVESTCSNHNRRCGILKIALRTINDLFMKPGSWLHVLEARQRALRNCSGAHTSAGQHQRRCPTSS